MATISGQPQFRYTQPPSKVVHLRNLPWECTEPELIELGTPFGQVVNTKCNVGANKNQAFIEFADLNQAIGMISYYASSAEPAQVRGKTVYLQYSNRPEIVNSKSTGETPGNVLLVTLEGVELGDVSIDVLHLVFSAFGIVQKIATFEKTAGVQALIQFSDSVAATSARNALDGRSIPKYLIPEVESCNLKITFSAHADLNVKFQSHRSRDYTNPYLPVAPSAIDGSIQDDNKLDAGSNVLLVAIENMQYAVTIDVLHRVFSAFGFVQKIAIFEKGSGLQALIQYPDVQTASVAKQALEGHPIYEGGFCKLHITYSRHTHLNVKINNDRGRDYTGGNMVSMNNQPSILGPQPGGVPGPAFPYSNGVNAYPGASSGATTSSSSVELVPLAGVVSATMPPFNHPYVYHNAVPPQTMPYHPYQPIHEVPPGVASQFGLGANSAEYMVPGSMPHEMQLNGHQMPQHPRNPVFQAPVDQQYFPGFALSGMQSTRHGGHQFAPSNTRMM